MRRIIRLRETSTHSNALSSIVPKPSSYLTARLTSCEQQPNENNHTYGVVEAPSLLSISSNSSSEAGYPVRTHFLFDAVTDNLLTFRARPLLAAPRPGAACSTISCGA